MSGFHPNHRHCEEAKPTKQSRATLNRPWIAAGPSVPRNDE
jgi:hypothetical protein